MNEKAKSETIRWVPGSEPDRYDLPEGELYRRAGWLTIVTGLAVVLCLLALARLLIEVYAPPQLVGVTASGWAFSGKAEKFKPSREMDEMVFDQVFEKAWLRTEQGGLNDTLRPFVGTGILEYLASLNANRMKHNEAFRISAVILEKRDAGPRSPSFVSLMYRARLNIRVLRGDDSASSIVFFNAVFRKSQPTVQNPLGWRMVEVKRILPEHFYADEAKAREAEVFKTQP